MRANTPVTALAIALALAACQQPPDAAETDTAVLEALEQVRDRHVDAVLEKDVDEGLATYTGSAVVVPPGNRGAVGAREIRAWMRGFHDTFTVERLEISLADHTVREDLAVAHYRYGWSVAPAGGGEPVRDTGQGLWVFERQADGGWLIAYDLWNSDGGATDGEQ